MTHASLLARLMVVGLLPLGCSAAAQAQQAPPAKTMTTLKDRQELMRLITQQQQAVLQQRFNCINRAGNLAELDRCERGYPVMGPGRPHGGCPMW